MKHLVAEFFHVLMTDLPYVSLLVMGARVASCERKNVSGVRFSPLLKRLKKGLIAGSKISSILFKHKMIPLYL